MGKRSDEPSSAGPRVVAASPTPHRGQPGHWRGLAQASPGAQVVVDVRECPLVRTTQSGVFFSRQQQHPSAAEAAAGVGHHCSHIVRSSPPTSSCECDSTSAPRGPRKKSQASSPIPLHERACYAFYEASADRNQRLEGQTVRVSTGGGCSPIVVGYVAGRRRGQNVALAKALNEHTFDLGRSNRGIRNIPSWRQFLTQPATHGRYSPIPRRSTTHHGDYKASPPAITHARPDRFADLAVFLVHEGSLDAP